MSLTVINPTTGELIREYPESTYDDVKKAIKRGHEAFLSWKQTHFNDRSELMKRVAQILRERKNEYGTLMAQEMGKPIKEGRAEIEKCAWVCDYYAENSENFLKPKIVSTDAKKSYIAFLPLGIVLAIMPWNFPFWQVFRFAVPALMARNAALLKHAPNVSGCALAIENVFRKAGFPEHLFQTLLIDVSLVSSIIEDSRVKAVTLTGSTRAGKVVASKAGAFIKKTVLELGGSDPYIILEDANLDMAVTTCVISRLINSGQSCIAAKRFIVVGSIQEQFEKRMIDRMSEIKVGNPLDEDTQIGPQAREDLRKNLHRQVQESIQKGAICLLGGKIPEGKGYFYPNTVLSQVKKGMPAYDEEIFGPVAAIIPVKNEREAIQVANDSVFGLGAAVFTSNETRGEQIALNELEAGCCFVNDFVKSDPRLPFGGVKESGYGRELSSYGIKEFVNIKTIYLK